MGEKKHPSTAQPISDPKKKRRVGFSSVDLGIEANECIKIYLVSSKEEVGSSDCCCISPVDLSDFFEEDGKIYGYKELKITVWINIISFNTYADISYKGKLDGGKGNTYLKSSLQKIFADTIIENKDEFLQTFSTESQFVSSIVSKGETLPPKISNGHIANPSSDLASTSDLKVIHMNVENIDAGHLYCRLVPLVLLLIDGSNPIEVTDPGWELYVLIQGQNDQQGNAQHRLLGFTAVYRFYHYPEHTRLRLGQILVLPPYQHKGYGRYILEVLNNVAVSEDVYDLTVEEPLDHFQHVRTCIDVQRLLSFAPVKGAVHSVVSCLKEARLSKQSQVPRFTPPLSVVEDARRTLKINKKHFIQCWEVLIYIGLDSFEKYMENFVVIVSSRVKADILGKDSGTDVKQLVEVPSDYDPEMSFVVFRSEDGEAISSVQTAESQTNQEEQIKQLVDERVKEIKSIAQKFSELVGRGRYLKTLLIHHKYTYNL